MTLKRRLYRGRDVRRAQNIAELRSMAAARLPNFCLEYLEGGADDELTLHRNRASYDAIAFTPRTLVDVSVRDPGCTLFGQRIAMPAVIAPTGFNGLLAHEGDLALAEAARDAGIPMCQSMVSTVALERVAETGVRHWMQIYPFKNRENLAGIVRRAEAAGSEAIVVTTDVPMLGNREWDRRNYRAPMKLDFANLVNVAMRPKWCWDVLVPHGMPHFRNLGDILPPGQDDARNAANFLSKQMDPSLNWQDVQWLRDLWPRQLIIKGVVRPDDALRARALGVDALVITNHGGRQLDSCVAPIEVLPAIRAAVGPDMTLIVDSGLRRGGDFVKARALGADAAMSGRATLYGLAAGGRAGVAHALAILRAEIDRTLGLLGCPALMELSPDWVSMPAAMRGA